MALELATEYIIDADNLQWIPLDDGIEFKVLRTSAETGDWTVLFRCAKGAQFPPHWHYGAGEYYLLKGEMEYRMGVARAGTYGYEPNGVWVHERRGARAQSYRFRMSRRHFLDHVHRDDVEIEGNAGVRELLGVASLNG